MGGSFYVPVTAQWDKNPVQGFKHEDNKPQLSWVQIWISIYALCNSFPKHVAFNSLQNATFVFNHRHFPTRQASLRCASTQVKNRCLNVEIDSKYFSIMLGETYVLTSIPFSLLFEHVTWPGSKHNMWEIESRNTSLLANNFSFSGEDSLNNNITEILSELLFAEHHPK